MNRLAIVLAASVVSTSAFAADKATDFSLRDINGVKVTLSQYAGQVVVLDFWATWCGPCKVELPHMQKMYDADKDKGMVVLAISSDDARTASQVKPFAMRSGYTFPVLLDTDSTVVGRYDPDKTLPQTVVIGRDGMIVKVHSGYNPGDETEIAALVDAALAVPAPAK